MLSITYYKFMFHFHFISFPFGFNSKTFDIQIALISFYAFSTFLFSHFLFNNNIFEIIFFCFFPNLFHLIVLIKISSATYTISVYSIFIMFQFYNVPHTNCSSYILSTFLLLFSLKINIL